MIRIGVPEGACHPRKADEQEDSPVKAGAGNRVEEIRWVKRYSQHILYRRKGKRGCGGSQEGIRGVMTTMAMSAEGRRWPCFPPSGRKDHRRRIGHESVRVGLPLWINALRTMVLVRRSTRGGC